jgi:tetratricopeptide (TPR) repeat protein
MAKLNRKERESLDFEIGFFEEVLKKKPDYTEVLQALGNAYTTRGLYQKGLEVDMKFIALRPRDPIGHYNLACSYSCLKDIEAALKALTRAVELGSNDLFHMAKDPDLANLRKDKRFLHLIVELRKKKARGRR